jgi:hypothetical protein
MAVAMLFERYIFAIERDYEFILIQNFFCIAYVTQFCLICWISTLARQESNMTGRIIYEIILKCKPVNLDKHEASNLLSLEVPPPLEDVDSEQRFNRSSSHNLSYANTDNILRRNLDRQCVIKEINDFSIQLQQHRVAFRACNFFEINNSLFKGVSALFTYLITIFVELAPFELLFQ